MGKWVTCVKLSGFPLLNGAFKVGQNEDMLMGDAWCVNTNGNLFMHRIRCVVGPNWVIQDKKKGIK